MRQPLLIIVLFLASAAIARDFRFTLEQYPNQGSNCLALTESISEKFAVATSVVPTRVLCSDGGAGMYRISIEYENDTEIPFVSTWKSWGRFPSKAQCNAVLETERMTYIHETGLSPAFVYCAHAIEPSKRPWAPHIVGFGNSIKDYFIDTFSITAHVQGIEPFKERVAAMLEQNDGKLVDLVTQSSGLYADYGLHYYSVAGLSVTLEEIARSKSRAHCERQQEQWTTLMSASYGAPNVTFCSEAIIGGEWKLSSIFMGRIPLRNEYSAETFPSFDTCEADKETLMKVYASSLKKELVGALCSYRFSRMYQAVFFHLPK